MCVCVRAGMDSGRVCGVLGIYATETQHGNSPHTPRSHISAPLASYLTDRAVFTYAACLSCMFLSALSLCCFILYAPLKSVSLSWSFHFSSGNKKQSPHAVAEPSCSWLNACFVILTFCGEVTDFLLNSLGYK